MPVTAIDERYGALIEEHLDGILSANVSKGRLQASLQKSKRLILEVEALITRVAKDKKPRDSGNVYHHTTLPTILRPNVSLGDSFSPKISKNTQTNARAHPSPLPRPREAPFTPYRRISSPVVILSDTSVSSDSSDDSTSSESSDDITERRKRLKRTATATKSKSKVSLVSICNSLLAHTQHANEKNTGTTNKESQWKGKSASRCS